MAGNSAANPGAGAVHLLTSTNVAAPRNTWTPLLTNVQSGSSSFTTNLSNAVNPALNQQFYCWATQITERGIDTADSASNPELPL